MTQSSSNVPRLLGRSKKSSSRLLSNPSHIQEPQTETSNYKRDPMPSQDEPDSSDNYNIPDEFIRLDELASTSPVQNPHEHHIYRQEYLEERRSTEEAYREAAAQGGIKESRADVAGTVLQEKGVERASKIETEFYTISYLISFSICGTLARLGLQAITAYPGSPVTTSELWANVGGSVIMGFLSEDRRLFHEHRKVWNNNATDSQSTEDSEGSQETVGGIEGSHPHISNDADPEKDRVELLKAHTAMKKTIPLYIGLTTGFCGSFTSFSSFIRDVFFELANLPSAVHIPDSSTPSRNGGHSFMALVAVIIMTVSICLSGLKFGAHLAIGVEKFTPPLPRFLTRRNFDRCAAVFSWGLWLGSVLMVIWPPDQTWRGEALFAIVFSPLGCVMRFYLSIWMNSFIAGFPLGTFTVNILGTAILGMCWDLQHSSLHTAGGSIGGGLVGCQVLQGIQDGFCGCLTTISTWVLELTSLRRRHAYIYGGVSVVSGMAILVIIIGSLIWSVGASASVCSA
ncbi:CrcB-like protein [Xylogone sp. PMI_703]|nr:CrcB-like protein [Xylogone sp. PMI_703]